ncbi:MAG TPA: hypothetical protein VGI20_09380 [Rhizomicrobium sp.]|jgi:hypothetical protein
MRPQQIARTVISVALVFGAMAFLNRHDQAMPVMVGIIGAVVAIIYAVQASPRAIAFIAGHPKNFRIAGIITVAGAVLLIVLISIEFPNVKPDDVRVTAGPVGLMMLGILIFTLPRSVRLSEVAKLAAQKPNPADVPEGRKFGIEDGIDSNNFVLRNFGTFLRIAGPWAALYALVPLAAFQVAAVRGGIIRSVFEPVPTNPGLAARLSVLLTYALISFVGIPMVAVAWHRFVAMRQAPRFGLVSLNKDFWQYAFRIWTFGTVMAVLYKLVASNAADINRVLGTRTSPSGVEIVDFCVWTLALWSASSFALVLPATSVSDRDMDIMRSIRATTMLGKSYRIGFLVALLPLFVASVLLTRWFKTALGPSLSNQMLAGIAPSFLFFFAVAAGATYLSHAYQAANQSGTHITSAV